MFDVVASWSRTRASQQRARCLYRVFVKWSDCWKVAEAWWFSEVCYAERSSEGREVVPQASQSLYCAMNPPEMPCPGGRCRRCGGGARAGRQAGRRQV